MHGSGPHRDTIGDEAKNERAGTNLSQYVVVDQLVSCQQLPILSYFNLGGRPPRRWRSRPDSVSTSSVPRCAVCCSNEGTICARQRSVTLLGNYVRLVDQSALVPASFSI